MRPSARIDSHALRNPFSSGASMTAANNSIAAGLVPSSCSASSWSSSPLNLAPHRSSPTPERMEALRIASPMHSLTASGPFFPSAEP
jgi:hypothetical protein